MQQFHLSGEELSQWLAGVDPADTESVVLAVSEAVAFRRRVLEEEATHSAVQDLTRKVDDLRVRLRSTTDADVEKEVNRLLADWSR